MKIDFARLNHIFIPKGKEERDRFRRSWAGRVLIPVVGFFWGSLTDEGRSLVTVTFVVGAIGIDVRNTTTFVFFAILTGLIAGSMAAAYRLVLGDIVLSVDAPRRVTVGEAVTFTIVCAADGPRATRRPIRTRGPFLPWDGTWLDEPPGELVLRGTEGASATIRARFVMRGLHHLDPFTVAAVAPFGLACGPRRETEALKLHVVPRIANVVRLDVAIAARHQPGGVALASKSGEAMDLLGVRPYRPGDPVRDLHARSWARTGLPVVREYSQEYFPRVGVVLDTDMLDAETLEASIELAAGIIAYLSRGEALIDVLVVGDSVHEFTLGRSLGTLDQALELLATVVRGPVLSAAKLLGHLSPYLDRLSSVVLIVPTKGAEQQALSDGIVERGISCETIIVDAELRQDIRSGTELVLPSSRARGRA